MYDYDITEMQNILQDILIGRRVTGLEKAGYVLTVGDGIARVYGLEHVQAGEMVFVFLWTVWYGFKFGAG